MKTKLHTEIDGLYNTLKARGIEVQRCDIIEALAAGRSFRNSHEMMAAARKAESATPLNTPSADLATGASTDTLTKLIAERDQLREDIDRLERACHLDWPAWNKTVKGLKKHTHHGKQPLADDELHLLRLAVSDNHAKGSAGERSSAEYRVMEFARRRMPALLARLDRAEELLGEGECLSGPVLDLVAKAMQVDATRDGDTHSETFLPDYDAFEDLDDQATELAAKGFSIDDEYSLAEGFEPEDRYENLRSDMDTFECEAACITLPVGDVVRALKTGEGSVLLHTRLMALGRELGLDPRGVAGTIYPVDEG
ncbi:hypothetical protein [Croceicoccus gelatinilyticus]|uniref:hypothetical protein n=1 Tax=Croceicoccus gelatinilyticus TaxID=2835536 RepID=UPI001BCA9F76|nr:hypothetical protein [Croceicoccus gelatinilyticus]MBS7671756.1 hypothetical protein [Croceicoccus gelatinilyticus]